MYKIYLIWLMRLLITSIFLTTALLQLSQAGWAQHVTLNRKQADLKTLFQEISKQSGYDFVYTDELLTQFKPIDIRVDHAPLQDVLQQVFQGQALDFSVADQTVVIKARPERAASPTTVLLLAYPEVRGRVVDSLGRPLQGATIKTVVETRSIASLQTSTDRNGEFVLRNVPEGAVLELSFVGYMSRQMNSAAEMGVISLTALSAELEEVEVMVNTGYQTLPKERATGSFSHIDQTAINRRAGFNILDRLDGVAAGLNYDLAGTNGEPTTRTNIRIRGLNTIHGETQPLIVVDGFPYEGNIENINPNDVVGITVLKDAAAASIWGARAGNGVIVITTKSGSKMQKPKIELRTNLGFGKKPDLFYDPRYIPSSDLIDLEVDLFEKGIYTKNDWTELSPVVDLLFSEATDDQISEILESWKENDIRSDAERYLYKKSFNQQYSLAIQGGSDRHVYAISAGYDHKSGVLYRDRESRITLSLKNNFRLANHLEVQNTLNFVQQAAQKNGLGIIEISPLT